ncbi:MAG: DUF1844 domain-containing protein [Blastocatellia bacterium]|nr:DUF1844 domain-containing protein [Blastocatellia bacterium]
MPEENESGFKVTDRRLFNADGSLRDDAPQEEPAAAEEPPAAVGAPPPTFTVSQGAAPAAFAPAEAPMEMEMEMEEADPNEMPEQTMFTEFLMGIASSAFIYLGLVEHPATGRRQVDLRAAKEAIDMLLMLREKTKGNLTRGEEKFFDDLLADLKMQFVSLRR